MLVKFLTIFSLLCGALRLNASCDLNPNDVFGVLPDYELAAMKDLYDSTAGVYWTYCTDEDENCQPWSFAENVNPCTDSWEGVACKIIDNETHLFTLSLNLMNLTGTLPSTIGNFSELCELLIGNNRGVVGSIPSSIGKLSELQLLQLYGNELNLEIPVEIGKLLNLELIDFRSNYLHGDIPVELGNLFNLHTIKFDDNLLSGPIPPEIGKLTNLTTLQLNNNQFSNTLPSELSNLVNLTILDFSYNFVNGTLPASFGSYLRLQEFRISNTDLSGQIPAELGALTSLTLLWIIFNDFSGTIPPELGQLSNLTELQINSHSALRGTVPKELGNLLNLHTLFLSANHLLPSELGQLKNLSTLQINSNFLNGTIPSEFGDLTNLQYLDLTGNHMIGSIPSSFGRLSQLLQLNLYSNYFYGTLPPELGELSNLEIIRVFYNVFSGSIPPEYGNLKALTNFEAYSNFLNGTIPLELCDLSSVQTLMLANNQINGSIPYCIGNLKNLNNLQLDDLHLDGSIPESIVDCSSLHYIYLEDNFLTGTIPKEFGNLTTLYQINLNYNHLEGSLPASLGNMTKLNNLEINNNQLTGSIPPELINCTQLATIDLSNNHLSQHIPEIFGGVVYKVQLQNNHLSGPIPKIYTNSLVSILLSNNHLSKHIPPTLFNFSTPNLVTAEFQYNSLTGSIPPNINQLSLCTSIKLQNNFLSGEIPGKLSGMKQLDTFSVDYNQLSGTIPRDVGRLPKLMNLLLFHNFISGTVPETIGEMKSLVILALNDNLLTGSIPTQLQYLNSLTIFFVHHNILTGTLDEVFDSSIQPRLLYVDVSNNQFIGHLPVDVFRIGTLFSFAAVSNCFTGSIPPDICVATNLSTLALDGLMSATSCQMRFFPWASSYGLPNAIEGGFPDCLLSLPTIRSLHLSGNGLTGTIHPDIVIGSNLADLSLSHNNLKGELPSQLQNHNFTNLDLSYNKFRGTLDSDIFATYGFNGSLSLQVNRLSGEIPPILHDASDITILDGNLYECDSSRSDLPVHDEYAHIYECGSNTFNYTMYFWIVVVLCVGSALVGLVVLTRAGYVNIVNSNRVKAIINDWLVVFDETNNTSKTLDNIVAFGTFVVILRRMTVAVTLVVVFICLPVYSILSLFYDTYTYEYAWVVTACYTSGEVPSAVLLLLFVLFGVCLIFAMFEVSQVTKCTRPGKKVTTEVSSAIDSQVESKEVEKSKNQQEDDDDRWTWSQYAVTIFLVALNLGLVMTVNILYVIVDHNYSSGIVKLAQLSVAIFKIMWKNFIVRLLLSVATPVEKKVEKPLNDEQSLVRPSDTTVVTVSVGRESIRQSLNDTARKGYNLSIAVFVTIFNNIAAPFFATCYASSNCFFNVVNVPPSVTVSYEYAMCTYGNFNGNYTACQVFAGTEVHSTTYDPPFIYSFQCSSTFITTYSSIYVFMFTFEAFFVPLVMWGLVAYHERYGGPMKGKGKLWLKMESMIPLILQSVRTNVSDNRSVENKKEGQQLMVPYFECAVFIVKLLNIFSILVTFGAILPPVAVVCCVAVLSATFHMQLFIGRFIANVRSALGPSSVLALMMNDDCSHAAWMFLDSMWMLLPFSVIFFALFLFDVLGDSVGWYNALWAPLLIFSGSIAVWLIFKRTKGYWLKWIKAARTRAMQRRRGSSSGATLVHIPEYSPLSVKDEEMMTALHSSEN